MRVSFWKVKASKSVLTHWGRVTHICVGKLTIIGSDNGLSPERRQAIIWINAGILLIGPLGTDLNEISIGIQTFSLKKCISKYRLRNGVHFVSASCVNGNTNTSHGGNNYPTTTQHSKSHLEGDKWCCHQQKNKAKHKWKKISWWSPEKLLSLRSCQIKIIVI